MGFPQACEERPLRHDERAEGSPSGPDYIRSDPYPPRIDCTNCRRFSMSRASGSYESLS